MSEGKNQLGFTQRQLEIVLDFCKRTSEYPRMTYSEFHRKHSPYSRKQSTIQLLNKAYSRMVLSGPFIFCNKGIEVTLEKNGRSPLRMLEEKKRDGETNYAIALCGDWSLISFKYGASMLQHTCTVIPSSLSSASTQVEDLMFDEKGTLSRDPYPERWDELDWKVYKILGSPREITYFKAGQKLGVSWKTVGNRFEKIMRQCKVLTCFFPLGYRGYNQLFVTFRTEYETGLIKALKRLDRTTYLWKCDNIIILNLFLLPDPMSPNRATGRFQELEEIGIIHDLHVSIPIQWHDVFV